MRTKSVQLVLALVIAVVLSSVWTTGRGLHARSACARRAEPWLPRPLEDAGRCTFGTCFNLSRCNASNFTIYVYPPLGKRPVPPVVSLPINATLLAQQPWYTERDLYIYHEYMQALRNSPYRVDDPDDACLLFPDLQRFSRDPPTFWHWGGNPRPVNRVLARLPHWQQGVNHVLFDQSDVDHPWFGEGTSYAMYAKSSFSTAWYRPHFDVAWPCPNAFLFAPHVRTKTDRKYLSSFIGNDQRRKARLALFALSDEDNPYRQRAGRDHAAYARLLAESQFGICPRGVGLHTRRVLETLAAGSVPVILADNWVPPFSGIVNWTEFSLIYDEADAHLVKHRLQRLRDSEQFRAMKRRGFDVFNRVFMDVEQWIATMLQHYEALVRKAAAEAKLCV